MPEHPFLSACRSWCLAWAQVLPELASCLRSFPKPTQSTLLAFYSRDLTSLHPGSKTNNKPSPRGPPAWEAEKGDPGLPAQAARRMTNTTGMPSCDSLSLQFPMPACWPTCP